VHPQAEQESILGHFLLRKEDLEPELVVLDHLLVATTKNRSSSHLFSGKSAPSFEEGVE